MAKKIYLTEKLRRRIRTLYWEDGRKPLMIYKMTGVHPDTVREICYARRT